MIRAILAGTKTQTRRLCKPEWLRCLDPDDAEDRAQAIARCPYGAPGDRLWVKEKWATSVACDDRFPPHGQRWPVWYRADGDVLFTGARHGGPAFTTPGKTRVSINMPRWASRITLELTDVRVERVQSISEADIAAEGVTAEAAIDLFFDKRPVGVLMPLARSMRPIDAWRIVWSTINGAESWGSNPWVWVLGFRRVES